MLIRLMQTSKKILKFQPDCRTDQGGGKFGWIENFNEHPIVRLSECFKSSSSTKVFGFGFGFGFEVGPP